MDKHILPYGLSITFFLIIISFSIVSLILYNMTLDASLRLPFEFIKDLKENWNLNYITNIIATDSYICPDDYQLLYSNQWPGTKDGCHCNAVVYIGNCKDNGKDNDENCKTIKGIDAIKYQTWNDRRICAKRGKGGYFSLNVYESICPTLFPKKCGIIDSQNNFLCVGLTENCPINDIKIMTNFAADAFSTSASMLYQTATLSDKTLISTIKNTNGKIPIHIKISDNTPCVDPRYENYYKGQSYVLDNYFKRETCYHPTSGKRTDDNYVKLDSNSITRILRENGIYAIYDKVSTLPLFPKEKLDHDASLYSRGYYGVKESCRITLKNKINDLDEFITYLDDLSTYSENSSRYIYKVQVPLILQLVIAAIWFCVNLYKMIIANYVDYTSGCSTFIMIMSFATLAITVFALSFFVDVYQDFRILDTTKLSLLSGCLDSSSEVLLTSFISTTSSLKTYGITVSVLLGLNLGNLLFELIIWRCCSVHTEEEEAHASIAETSMKNNVIEISPTKKESMKKMDKNSLSEQENLKHNDYNSDNKENEEVTKTPNKHDAFENNRVTYILTFLLYNLTKYLI